MITETFRKGYYNKLILILWLFFIFLLWKGFAYGRGGHVYVLPCIYKIAFPDFLNGGWYINALISYHYLFNLFYAKLMHYINLPLLFFFSYCVALFLYIISLKRLSNILFKQDGPFYILFPLLMIWSTSGIEINALIHSNIFESLFLATPISIFAIVSFFEGKITKSFILAGIATVIHLQIGVNMFIILLLCYLILNFQSPLKIFKNIGISILCYLIISAWPLIINLQRLFATEIVGNSHFYIDYARFRIPHHIILSSWSTTIVNFILLCCFGFISFIKKQSEEVDKKSIIFVSVVFMTMCIQYIFYELIPIDSLAKFQFYRMSIFVSMIAFMYIANYLYNILNTEKSFFVFLVVITIIFCKSSLLSLILLLLIYLVTNNKEPARKKYLLLSLILVSFVFAIGIIGFRSKFLYALYKLSTNNLLSFSPKLVIFAIITASFFNMLLIKIKKPKFNLYSKYLISLLILSTLIIGLHIKNDFFYNINLRLVPRNPWQKLCFWVKENTSSQDFFIIPPYKQGFHLYAERKELVDFKSGPHLEKDILEWKKRLEDVTGVDDIFSIKKKGFASYDFMKERYNSLSENEIKRLAEKYNADYIIFEKPKVLPFEIFHQTKGFIIYKIH